ncbi:hypothetical protein DSECCO2_462910 [anaerobic digester metagenome]
MGRATRRARSSVCRDAYIFGPISPNIRIRSTVTPNAMTIPALPYVPMAIAVASTATATFATVFPIRVVSSILSVDRFSASSAFAPFRPWFKSACTFARVIDIRATSELEKKPERNRLMKSSMISIVARSTIAIYSTPHPAAASDIRLCFGYINYNAGRSYKPSASGKYPL